MPRVHWDTLSAASSDAVSISTDGQRRMGPIPRLHLAPLELDPAADTGVPFPPGQRPLLPLVVVVDATFETDAIADAPLHGLRAPRTQFGPVLQHEMRGTRVTGHRQTTRREHHDRPVRSRLHPTLSTACRPYANESSSPPFPVRTVSKVSLRLACDGPSLSIVAQQFGGQGISPN